MMNVKKTPTNFRLHGKTLADDYGWIKNVSDPDVIPLLHHENEKTGQKLAHVKDVQETIFQEIVSRILEDDEGFPYPMGDYEYFYKLEKGKNYPTYYRKKKNGTGEILLDLNEKAQGKGFLHLSSFRISPDQNKIAFGLDFDGSEKYQIVLQDLTTGTILETSIPDTCGDFEWGDDQTLYYVRMDSTHRPDRVFVHTIGMDSKLDPVIYEDPNLSYFVGLDKSKSERFLWIQSASKITTEVSFIDLSKSKNQISLFHPRMEKIKYVVDHQENRFIIRTNENAINFMLMETSIDQIEKKNWKSLVEHDPERFIEGLDVFKNFLVISERYKGLQNFRVLDSQNKIDAVTFEEPLYAINTEHNEVYDTTTLRFTYSSMKTPLRVQHFDMKSKKTSIVHEKKVPNYNSKLYEMERHLAPSRDSKNQVPISLIYKKGCKFDGKAPLFLYGYGSYGMSRNPSFSPSLFSLLDRGFVYAIAHVRGGSECGRNWYYDGKFLKKKNTFYDFIDCAKYLIEKKFTSEKKIAVCGGSAGGLLMGAITNMEPELWGAVVALVPFVDIVNTMMDDKLPLTVTEYDEWGNPNEKEFFDYMLSYSPYDNIVPKKYPPILATGGLHDPRVGYWEPTKWVLKLRENQQAKNPILLKMQMEAGHQGPSGRYEAYKETAFYYSFVLDQIKKI